MLGPSRIVGLGGAYAGLAEGVDGVASNVAAPAVREPFSDRHFDYDLTASLSFPGALEPTDFENRGGALPNQAQAGANDFIYGNAGALVQVGPFGAALTLDITSFNSVSPSGSSLPFRVLRAHAIVAWAFFHHQLVIGAGVQGVTMNLSTSSLPLAPPSGVGPEAGMLLRLDGQPWRLGVSARAPVSGGVSSDVMQGSNIVLPSSVVLPAQFDVGFALQLGPRPLNPHWNDPADDLLPLRETIQTERDERAKTNTAELAQLPEGPVRAKRRRELDATENAIRRIEEVRIDAEEIRIREAHRARYTNWPRPKLLLVLDAVVTAPVDNAVAVSSFVDQTAEKYGRSWTISPRVGLEGEPVPDRFRLRFGSYLEPSLFDGGSARQHFTFGGDLKLFEWDAFGLLAPTMWQVSFATDFAPRYTNWSISLGVWR